MSRAYAEAGVDYSKIGPFKRALLEVSELTRGFPERYGVYIDDGGVHRYTNPIQHGWKTLVEGLGNKNWIGEWMYQYGDGKTYYDALAADNALMAVNDVLAFGAMPVVYADEVAAGTSDWFADEIRAADFARGMYDVCQEVGMALVAGESPALRYLVNSRALVGSAPVLSGAVTGIIAPYSRRLFRSRRSGDVIVVAESSGIHANGISLIIDRAMQLPDTFMTVLPGGKTLGETVLTKTRSYVALVRALFRAGVTIHELLPGTGSGIAKLVSDPRSYTYVIDEWVEVPMVMQWLHEYCHIPLYDCLTTFNWGAGYYLFISKKDVDSALAAGEKAGYKLSVVGRVMNGDRKVIFGHAGGLEILPTDC